MRSLVGPLTFVGPLTAVVVLAACGSAGQTSTPGIDGTPPEPSAPAASTDVGDTDATIPPATVDGDAEPTSTDAPSATTTIAPSATDAPPATPAAPATDASPPATDPAPVTDPPGPSGDTAAADPSKSWWFVGTEEGDPEATSDGANCLDLYESQGAGTLSYSRCGPWESFNGSYMWTVIKGASDRFQAVVWQQTADPFTWVPKMKLVEPGDDSGSVPSGWSSVTIITADVDSGPAEELLAGVTLDGTGAFLFFDVIDIRSGNPQPIATVHDLDRGRALPDDSVGVAFYTPIVLAGEPNCCPTTWDQFLLTITSGGWAVVDVATSVPTAAVPANEL